LIRQVTASEDHGFRLSMLALNMHSC